MKGWETSKVFTLVWGQESFELPLQLDDFLSIASESQQIKGIGLFLKDWYSDSPHISQFTSGSTSQPKEVQLDKSKMCLSAQRTNHFFGLDENSVFLISLGIDYIAGKMQLLRAMMAGARLIVVEPSNSPLEGINNPIDFATFVPAQLLNSSSQLHLIKTVLLGGAAPTGLHLKCIQEAVSTDFYIGYGMTETYSHIAIKKLSDQEAHFHAMEGVSFGLNKQSCLSLHDSILELDIHTRDRVELIDQSSFKWLGRIDFVINSGGRKIQIEPIEELLSSYCPNELMLIGIEDDKWGEKAILLVEGSQNAQVLEKLNVGIEQLPKADRPKEIHFVKSFQRTWTAKLDRLKTRSLFLEKTKSKS